MVYSYIRFIFRTLLATIYEKFCPGPPLEKILGAPLVLNPAIQTGTQTEIGRTGAAADGLTNRKPRTAASPDGGQCGPRLTRAGDSCGGHKRVSGGSRRLDCS